MDLELIRDQIDLVDGQIVALLEKRMALVSQVAAYKQETGKAVFDGEREAALLEKVVGLVENPDYQQTIVDSYSDILRQSRAYQTEQLSGED